MCPEYTQTNRQTDKWTDGCYQVHYLPHFLVYNYIESCVLQTVMTITTGALLWADCRVLMLFWTLVIERHGKQMMMKNLMLCESPTHLVPFDPFCWFHFWRVSKFLGHGENLLVLFPGNDELLAMEDFIDSGQCPIHKLWLPFNPMWAYVVSSGYSGHMWQKDMENKW